MRYLEASKGPLTGTRFLAMTSALALIAASAAVATPAFADEAAAKKWIDAEFQPSTLSKDDQMKEMQWFIKAAAPFKGMEINAVSETLTVHEYESKTLAKAFEEITGIKVKHDIIQEGDVLLNYGGNAVNEVELSPGEFNGKSIVGGSSVVMHAGDIVIIPAGTWHEEVIRTPVMRYILFKTKK